jgi:hypothetical protein
MRNYARHLGMVPTHLTVEVVIRPRTEAIHGIAMRRMRDDGD